MASLIQAHNIKGDEGGIRGATYWTWYRHEVWVAFQTHRRMFLDEGYWQPMRINTFEGLSMRDIANRVLFIFGQCISYHISTSYDNDTGDDWIQSRKARGNELKKLLTAWEENLPRRMRMSCTHQPLEDNSSRQGNIIPGSIWFFYPESGTLLTLYLHCAWVIPNTNTSTFATNIAVSHQLYHASRILLELHTSKCLMPQQQAYSPLRTHREIQKSRQEIFMIAKSLLDEAWGLISTQCLYIAGLVTDGILERQLTLELIERCQKTSGRQTVCIADQLRQFWSE